MGGCGGGCGCGMQQRKFYTREEQIEWMKEYKDGLELELEGINEKLSWLEKNKK